MTNKPVEQNRRMKNMDNFDTAEDAREKAQWTQAFNQVEKLIPEVLGHKESKIEVTEENHSII